MAGLMNTIVQPSNVDLDNGTKSSQLIHSLRPVYNETIAYKALPIMRFSQFASYKADLMAQPGLTIQMPTFNDIVGGGKLEEGKHIVPTAMSSSMRSITVTEHGNAISVSELALVSSYHNVMRNAIDLLSRNVAITVDRDLRDCAIKGEAGRSVIYGRSSETKISDRTAITKANTLSVAAIKDAVEILATANAPKWGDAGDYYVCMVHPHQSRVLRDDKAWIEASKYGAPDQLFYGEIGRIDDVRFIETTLMPQGENAADVYSYNADLAKGASGSSTECPVYQSLIFGRDYYGYAVALFPELRDGGIKDFGREHSLAWYAIYGAGILNPERGVLIETC